MSLSSSILQRNCESSTSDLDMAENRGGGGCCPPMDLMRSEPMQLVQRQVSQPQVSFTSKCVSVLYDVEEKNAFVKSTVDVSPRLQLRALHNVKAQQGEQPPEKKQYYTIRVVGPQKIESPIQKLESKFDTNKVTYHSLAQMFARSTVTRADLISLLNICSQPCRLLLDRS
ncbi:hypothetical protein Bca4012_079644 [Brassica carinata]